jgi:hypothetical protein
MTFIEKVTSLMTKFNPDERKPSLKRIWTWLKWLLEEYMHCLEPFAELKDLLCVDTAKEVVEKVRRLRRRNASVGRRRESAAAY